MTHSQFQQLRAIDNGDAVLVQSGTATVGGNQGSSSNNNNNNHRTVGHNSNNIGNNGGLVSQDPILSHLAGAWEDFSTAWKHQVNFGMKILIVVISLGLLSIMAFVATLITLHNDMKAWYSVLHESIFDKLDNIHGSIYYSTPLYYGGSDSGVSTYGGIGQPWEELVDMFHAMALQLFSFGMWMSVLLSIGLLVWKQAQPGGLLEGNVYVNSVKGAWNDVKTAYDDLKARLAWTTTTTTTTAPPAAARSAPFSYMPVVPPCVHFSLPMPPSAQTPRRGSSSAAGARGGMPTFGPTCATPIHNHVGRGGGDPFRTPPTATTTTQAQTTSSRPQARLRTNAIQTNTSRSDSKAKKETRIELRKRVQRELAEERARLAARRNKNDVVRPPAPPAPARARARRQTRAEIRAEMHARLERDIAAGRVRL